MKRVSQSHIAETYSDSSVASHVKHGLQRRQKHECADNHSNAGHYSGHNFFLRDHGGNAGNAVGQLRSVTTRRNVSNRARLQVSRREGRKSISVQHRKLARRCPDSLFFGFRRQYDPWQVPCRKSMQNSCSRTKVTTFLQGDQGAVGQCRPDATAAAAF